MDAYMQSLPIDAQCLITGLLALVCGLGLAGLINLVEFIFGGGDGDPGFDWDDDDNYTGAER